MTKAPPSPRTHLFTVRLWLEDLGEGHTAWQGKAHHVVSGEVRYCHDYPALVASLNSVNFGRPIIKGVFVCYRSIAPTSPISLSDSNGSAYPP